jgi:hypothetical protein
MRFLVNEKALLGLNLRSAPVVADKTKIAILPTGHQVTKVEDGPAGWVRVTTTLNGSDVEGFVSLKFLTPQAEAPKPVPARGVRAVHLSTERPVTRSNRLLAFPLNEKGMPQRDPSGTPQARVAQLGQIIEWLNVEKSARHQPNPKDTYCNIYATDFAYLAGVFLPRVWWYGPALVRLGKGESVAPVYGQTVAELNANSLLNWLKEFGSSFGWTREFDLTRLQEAANSGQVVVISAQQKIPNRSGHIAVVAPETATHKAVRSGAQVVRPLQSQAGRTNKRYWTPPAWWTGAQYKEFGFFVNRL